MGDVSEESLLDYFYSTGGSSGRVKNADLLKTFKPFIGHSDLQFRAKYREEFKLIIDRIAVVKSENGEKYLVLKKKYRQMLHERDTKHHGTDADGQSGSSPARAPATVQWDATDASASSHPQQDEQMSCGGPDGAAEDQQTGTAFMQPTLLQLPVILTQGPSAQSNGDDELDKDSGSKSESEQDEESTGSMGSAAVALDPIEKEWIYSAAGARVPDLSQLLRQDPSLANKKDFTSGFTALHWAAKHGNKDMASLVANAGADVNTKSHGGYTPLHIAALHGHRHILDLLLVTYGAKDNLRDYSGHLACHYLNIKEPEGPEEDSELHFQVTQARERNRNRKLVSLFHSKKKWGSAEELAPIEEERTASHQLILPAFRPRKFSR
ncbi:ankyrin repeat domain-containing protein SOWAHC [Perca fluviatilis]|uniref:ankyrin repeat domain-containing protein SOWAHC n=1 Tax=Perca fluviatilis TaxID=8168 RepID=UPI001965935C|nr:ankyrin repeat domain-containing protein SOWAHC [Perca fluviatilis]